MIEKNISVAQKESEKRRQRIKKLWCIYRSRHPDVSVSQGIMAVAVKMNMSMSAVRNALIKSNEIQITPRDDN